MNVESYTKFKCHQIFKKVSSHIEELTKETYTETPTCTSSWDHCQLPVVKRDLSDLLSLTGGPQILSRMDAFATRPPQTFWVHNIILHHILWEQLWKQMPTQTVRLSSFLTLLREPWVVGFVGQKDSHASNTSYDNDTTVYKKLGTQDVAQLAEFFSPQIALVVIF